jgi:copper transport protein
VQGWLVIVFALLFAALPWRAVHAHAVLLESSPAENAVLAEAPERVVLRFNEPVRPAVIRLLRASDEGSVELASAQATDAEVRVPLPAGLPDGSYILSYRVTSADGHPVVGSFVFAIGAPGTAASPTSAAAGSEDFWRTAGVAARALWYGSLLLAAGLALFLALLPVPADLQPPLRRALPRLAVLGAVACLAMLGATGGALYGGPPEVLLRLEPWRVAVASPVAINMAVTTPGLALLVIAPRRVIRHERLVLLSGALCVTAGFAASGHAATAGPGWITVPTLILHTLCAAYWIGAFMPLLVALRRLPRDQVLVVLRSFSTGAVAAVAGLVLAGVVLSALQLRSPAALVGTTYGRLLLLKLALVALLLGIGALNRLVLTPALQRGAEAVARMRRTIGADLVLAAGVIVLSAGLGTVPPPRALAERAAAQGHASHGPRDYAVQATARGHHLVLVATPATPGENRIDLYLTDQQGQPLAAKAAEISWALPDMGVEALRVEAAAVESGHFQARVNFPLPGEWQVRADVLVDDFTKLPFPATVVVGR